MKLLHIFLLFTLAFTINAYKSSDNEDEKLLKDEIKEIVKEELDELRNKPQLKKEEDATYDEDADEFEEDEEDDETTKDLHASEDEGTETKNKKKKDPLFISSLFTRRRRRRSCPGLLTGNVPLSSYRRRTFAPYFLDNCFRCCSRSNGLCRRRSDSSRRRSGCSNGVSSGKK